MTQRSSGVVMSLSKALAGEQPRSVPAELTLEPATNSGFHGISFQMLLQQIALCHQREVSILEKELEDVRRRAQTDSHANGGEGDHNEICTPVAQAGKGVMLPPDCLTASSPEHTSVQGRNGELAACSPSLAVGRERAETGTSGAVSLPATPSPASQLDDSLMLKVQGVQKLVSQLASPSKAKDKGEPSLAGSPCRKVNELENRYRARDLSNGYANRIVHARGFDVLCVASILLNACFLGIQTDMAARRGDPNDLPDYFKRIDLGFCIWFSFELFTRICALGVNRFFCGSDWKWNIFDVFVVGGDMADTLSSFLKNDEETDEGGSSFQNLTAIRVLRLLRIVRTARVIRLVRFFKEFRLMVFSILQAALPLLWSMLLLAIEIFTFGVYLTQCATMYVHENRDSGGEALKDLQEQFSDLIQGIYVLFMCISGGVSWIEVSDPLWEAHWTNAVVFVFFIFFTMFAVLNIITGIFVDTAVHTANANREEQVLDAMYEEQAALEEISKVFEEVDSDKSGTITLTELKTHFENPVMRAQFSAAGIEVNDASSIFRLLDIDKSGEVSIKEFLFGCVKLKGQAKSIDMVTLMQENRRMSQKVQAMMGHIKDLEIQLTFIVSTLSGLGGENSWLKAAPLNSQADCSVKPACTEMETNNSTTMVHEPRELEKQREITRGTCPQRLPPLLPAPTNFPEFSPRPPPA